MRPEQGTMQSRAQAMAALLELLTDQPVIICNGFPSREAQKLADRPTHFYMIGSMGNAAAIGVGVALSKPSKKVIVFDGDGNVSWAWARLPATKPSIANITAGTPNEKRKNWGLIAGIAGVVTAVGIVAIILSVGSSGNATTNVQGTTTATPPASATAVPTATSAEPAPPPVPVKPSKTVQVIAVPLEAEVFVNNEKVSRSPAVLQVPEGDKVTAEVRLDGYTTKEIVLDGKKLRVEVKLVKVPVKGCSRPNPGATDVRDPWAKKGR